MNFTDDFLIGPAPPKALPSRTSALETISTRTTRAGSSQQNPINASTTAIARFVIAKPYAVLIDDHPRANDAIRDESELRWRARSRSRSIHGGARVRARIGRRSSRARFLPRASANSPELVSISRARRGRRGEDKQDTRLAGDRGRRCRA